MANKVYEINSIWGGFIMMPLKKDITVGVPHATEPMGAWKNGTGNRLKAISFNLKRKQQNQLEIAPVFVWKR